MNRNLTLLLALTCLLAKETLANNPPSPYLSVITGINPQFLLELQQANPYLASQKEGHFLPNIPQATIPREVYVSWIALDGLLTDQIGEGINEMIAESTQEREKLKEMLVQPVKKVPKNLLTIPVKPLIAPHTSPNYAAYIQLQDLDEERRHIWVENEAEVRVSEGDNNILPTQFDIVLKETVAETAPQMQELPVFTSATERHAYYLKKAIVEQNFFYYKCKKGDTYSYLTQRFGVEESLIKNINHLNTSALPVNFELKIPDIRSIL